MEETRNWELEDIKKMYRAVGHNIIEELAYMMVESGYPTGKRFPFEGKTYSKAQKKEYWLEDSEGEPVLLSTLVPNKPNHTYWVDLESPQFMFDLKSSVCNALSAWEQENEADRWIEAGGKCVYRHGWEYRGARARSITKEEAKKLRPKYSFGMGFYELSWTNICGERVLEFNELSENDMW